MTVLKIYYKHLAGEYAAQGLGYGALAATRFLYPKEQATHGFLKHQIEEEKAHLQWCRHRVRELGGKDSILNGVFFIGGVIMGGVSGLFGSGYALGFVNETEKQVLELLRRHQQRVPQSDYRSHKVIQQMIQDEAEHAGEAQRLGAKPLPVQVKTAMSIFGKLLTSLAAKDF